ncbi:helix-turn-helix transcriptional regulator [Cohnella cholangitidis]|uniref:YafY family transcriptional regulator n=1 Tax=Cohnella cholangitidis TaxID=2598458 RepID=A0A7G5C4P2_9BACL|nr:YafY family protein [Cohnella cholangitidis]QMV44176.1 YafY family transcriptional regulator [Cohnella cholangitidis]
MKLDRLLGIVIMLINRRMIQAKELADHFEVSVRTIYRDIEVINQAGIPVISYQGAGGGIGLSEGYRLDRNVLTNNELVAIVTALQSVSTTYDNPNHKQLLEKMQSIVPAEETEQFQFRTQQFIVDLSPWGRKGHLEDKLAKLKTAVEESREVSFAYCSAQGEVTERRVEPYTLVLKKQTWYLYALCLDRRQFRLFKLFRMKGITVEERAFIRQSIPIEQMPWKQDWSAPETATKVVLRFHPRARHLAEEWFDVESLVAEKVEIPGKDAEERYVVSMHFPEDRWLYGFILSFGQDVEVLEPEHIRIKIREIAMNIGKIYDSLP